MDIQSIIVALVVVASAVYAAWTLMPASWRARGARQLLKLRWPERFATYLSQTAVGSSGCGCSGCDAHPTAPRKGRSSSETCRKVIPIQSSPKP